MNTFELCRQVIKDHSRYVSGFLNIKDERIRSYVERFFESGKLWPEVRIQLNPAYAKGVTVEELVEEGILHPDCRRIFLTKEGKSIRLYKHQEEAIRIASRGKSYVLTTGTGSGKSLCFFIPIVDHILKNNPEVAKVRAIIVYPMNALVNSQLDGFKRLLSSWTNCPVRVARYTGQEKTEEREALRNEPPHILLILGINGRRP
ncbi:DEAD/DEAH box helicase [Palaeococcus sp. (in: euryarchaeotes)]